MKPFQAFLWQDPRDSKMSIIFLWVNPENSFILISTLHAIDYKHTNPQKDKLKTVNNHKQAYVGVGTGANTKKLRKFGPKCHPG